MHVGDRESDIYALYCLAEELGTNFLVRSCVDRLAEVGDTPIAKVMAEVQSSGTQEVRFRDAQGKDHLAVLSVKHATMTVRPPIGKQRKYRHQDLQIIHAEEFHPPVGRAPVIWKLITNLPVATHANAVHKLEWYALRRKIETFLRTLKTGCRIEELRLATADRLANCIALYRVLARRVLWLTMLSREAPEASPDAVFTEADRHMLERATPDERHMAWLLTPRRPRRRSSHLYAPAKHLSVTASQFARLGTDCAIVSDPRHTKSISYGGSYVKLYVWRVLKY